MEGRRGWVHPTSHQQEVVWTLTGHRRNYFLGVSRCRRKDLCASAVLHLYGRLSLGDISQQSQLFCVYCQSNILVVCMNIKRTLRQCGRILSSTPRHPPTDARRQCPACLASSRGPASHSFHSSCVRSECRPNHRERASLPRSVRDATERGVLPNGAREKQTHRRDSAERSFKYEPATDCGI